MNPDQVLLRAFADGSLAAPAPVQGNPLALDLGATLLSADSVQGTLQMAFTPHARFVQGNGVVQGGIVAAMLDFACAFVVLMQLNAERNTATATLDVQFLRAVKAGRVLAHARVRRLGGRLAFASADLFSDDASSTLLASATASLPVW